MEMFWWVNSCLWKMCSSSVGAQEQLEGQGERVDTGVKDSCDNCFSLLFGLFYQMSSLLRGIFIFCTIRLRERHLQREPES